jgi:thymidylate synthase
MKQYHDYLKYILENGIKKDDRTGTGTISIFGYQIRFDLSKGFPLVTTKKLHFKSIVHELLWFLSGVTNIKYLQDNGVKIWNEWSNSDGELGPVYGKQWRRWESSNGKIIDQISLAIEQIKNNPDSRRIIINSWNVGDISSMALPPCHYSFQFYVANNKLSCMFQMRSVDSFLGLPYNIASYALLTHMIAQQCNLDIGDLIFTGGDCHIYLNHLEQVNLQLSREPLTLPTLNIKRKPNSIFDYKYEDFEIVNYQAHSHIKGAVAV